MPEDIRIVLLNEKQAIAYYGLLIEDLEVTTKNNKYVVNLDKLKTKTKQFSIPVENTIFEKVYNINDIEEVETVLEEKTETKKENKKLIYCIWKNFCNDKECEYSCCHHCAKKDKCKLPCKCKDKLSTCAYRSAINKNVYN